MPSGYFALIARGHGAGERTEQALLEGTGISSDSVTTTGDVTLGQQLRQLRNASRLLEPGWTLEIGARMSAVTHGANGIAIVCAPSMQQGLSVLTRYAHVRAPYFRFRPLDRGRDEVRIVVEFRVALTDGEQRALLDLIMLSTQAVIEARLGRPMYEAEFEFSYPAPAHAALYRDYFHAPVRFGCPQSAVVIPSRWLEVESPFADPVLYDLSLQQVQIGARRLHGDRLLVARVEQVLAQRGVRLRADQVARLVGVSNRTLTRRLGGQGTSFRALVDNSIKSRAVALLRDEELTLAEVAYALGYDDSANFSRAFRRWFDTSPGRYRARAAAGGSEEER